MMKSLCFKCKQWIHNAWSNFTRWMFHFHVLIDVRHPYFPAHVKIYMVFFNKHYILIDDSRRIEMENGHPNQEQLWEYAVAFGDLKVYYHFDTDLVDIVQKLTIE